ncbi:MAG: hypothetical protein Q9225_000574 [Loekoesia sp. 1 TL-2023]
MAEGKPTYPITITFTSPGACPPVYVAGSFTVPEWQPQELEYSVVEHKDAAADNQPNYIFSRTLSLPEGTFQYKFRLGHEGNWWVCDSNVDIVTDSAGNQNNRLVVVPPSQGIVEDTLRRRKDGPAPRVKLPEVTPPKVLQPNPNSWAAKQAQTHNKTPTATTRDKYENKPMPPTPEASPSPAEKPLTVRKNRGYIQPAIPLTSPGVASSSMKNRAVTDPVMPKPLFTSTTTTVNQLRKKYSQTKNKPKSKEDEEPATHRPTSPPLVIAHKASQILGVYPLKDNNRATPPVSAPPSTNTPDPFRTSTESASGRHVSPSRQVHSTPVPTRRYLQENNLPVQNGARASQDPKEAPKVPVEERKSDHSKEGSDGLLNPARLGVCGRKGEVGYVDQNEMQRVPSFAGIIEHPDSLREGKDTMEPDSAKIDWNENTLRPQYSGEILYPMVYTPNNYAGVWENDPNVGRTLPPFSPFPQRPPSDIDQRAVSQTSGDVPIILRRYPGESSFGSGYTHSLQSQNSWALSGNGNSFAQADPPSSGAATTPRFPTHMRNNSVPPPPLSYSGFQPSGPLPPGFVQMELNLHHHIETFFGSLMRLTTDNTDRTIDKVVRRVEDLQETIDKGFKGFKDEVKDMRKELTSIRKELADRPRTSETLKDSISSLSDKLVQLDKKIDEIGDRYQRNADDISGSEQGPSSSAYSQGKASPSRRSQSVHTSVSSRPEPRQPHLGPTAHTSASTHNSSNSSRGKRSNTTNNSGAGVRGSDERSARRELFAEFGTTNGQVPDIRDHPAYRGVAEGYGQSSPIFQAPDFGQTWYQHAFGPRQQ